MSITNLLKTKGEGKPLKWTMECQVEFEKLKCLFSAEPVLEHPNQMCSLSSNASDVAVEAVLLQKNEQGVLHPHL